MDKAHVPRNFVTLFNAFVGLLLLLWGFFEILAWLEDVLFWGWLRPGPVRHDHSMGAVRRANTATVPSEELIAWFEVPAVGVVAVGAATSPAPTATIPTAGISSHAMSSSPGTAAVFARLTAPTEWSCLIGPGPSQPQNRTS